MSTPDTDATIAELEEHFPLTFPKEVGEVVRAAYGQAEGIVEYGSGGSTLLAAGLGRYCVSVESSAEWAGRLEQGLKTAFPRAPVTMHPVDMGPTRWWGYPKDPSRWPDFHRYPLSVWSEVDAGRIDTVLIDGRMRKACFAATLLHITRPTTIYFDDYRHRQEYHEVEEILPRSALVRRMAVFEAVPGLVSGEAMAKVIGWFSELK